VSALAGLLLSAALLLAAPLAAQDARLAERLPAAALPGVSAAVAEARAQGLPTEPLVQRALEGAARGVEPERIVAAVREQAAQLRAARDAIGADAPEADLAAAAGALYAGVPAAELERLRDARGGRPLAEPLVTLADFIVRGVPRDVALSVVLSLVNARLSDRSFAALRRSVAEDILRGLAPAEAASYRARNALLPRRPRPRINTLPPGSGPTSVPRPMPPPRPFL
jgi:hypothetical protein